MKPEIYVLVLAAAVHLSDSLVAQGARAISEIESVKMELSDWERSALFLLPRLRDVPAAWAFYAGVSRAEVEGVCYTNFWNWMGFGQYDDEHAVHVTESDLAALDPETPFAIKASNTWSLAERNARPERLRDGAFPRAALPPFAFLALSTNDVSPSVAGYPWLEEPGGDAGEPGFYCVATSSRFYLIARTTRLAERGWRSRQAGSVALLHTRSRSKPVVILKSEADYWSRFLGTADDNFVAAVSALEVELEVPKEILIEAFARLSGVVRLPIKESSVKIRGGWTIRCADGCVTATLGKSSVDIPRGRLRTFSLSTGAEAAGFDLESVIIGTLGRYVIVVDGRADLVYQLDTEISPG